MIFFADNIRRIGRSLIALGGASYDLIARFGRILHLVYQILTSGFKMRGFITHLIRQTFNIGVLSLPIIVVAGAFIGMVLGLQGYNTLVDFGAEDSLGVLVALSLIRELGPVMTAILFAGRAGAALTTEIGLMKATQQLHALEMMAIDPMQRIMQPRLLAATLSVPALTAIFIFVGLVGAWFIGSLVLGVDSGSFWSQMQVSVDWQEDLINGMIKSLVFGMICTVLALYFGYHCRPTVDGTALATTQTVVYSSLSILGADFVLTAVMF